MPTYIIYGDTRKNRLLKRVDEDKYQQLIYSIDNDTDLWLHENIGLCEDNIGFPGGEEFFKYDAKWYITVPELSFATDINSGMHRVFRVRKELKRCLGDKFFSLTKGQRDSLGDFLYNNPNGVIAVGSIEEIKKKYSK